MATKIEINLEPSDLFQFYDFHFWNSPDRKRFRFMRRWGSVASTLIFFVIFVVVTGRAEVLLQLQGIAGMVVIGGFMYWWSQHSLLRRLRKGLMKNLREGKNVDVVGRRVFEFGDGSVRIKSDHSDSTVTAKSIEKLREDQFAYYLYSSTMGAYILPKRQMSAEQRQAFEAWTSKITVR